jgi:hypothetical protein
MALPGNLKTQLPAIASALMTLVPAVLQHEVWGKPIISSDTAVKADVDISSGTINITTFDAQPDYPRCVRLKFTGTGTAAVGKVTVATVPLVAVKASGTIAYGTMQALDAFKIREHATDVWTTWVYNVDFTSAATLNTLINGLSFVDSTVISSDITVAAATAGAAGNAIEMSQTGTNLTIVAMSGGVSADTLAVDGDVYTFVSSGPAAHKIVVGANQNDTATAIAARLTTDKAALGLTSATASTDTVTMTVTPVGTAGNSKVLTVDGTRMTKVQFVGGLDGIVGAVTVAGHDMEGEVLTEVLNVNTSTTLTWNTLAAFSDLTSVKATVTGITGASRLSLGVHTYLGLSHDVGSGAVKREVLDGVAATTLGTLDATNNTYLPNKTLDGAKVLELWYMGSFL